MALTITDIIGENKAFEPPFRVIYNTLHDANELCDKNGNAVLMMSRDTANEIMLAKYICDLLNREHVKQTAD